MKSAKIILLASSLCACATIQDTLQTSEPPVALESSSSILLFSDNDRKIASLESEFGESNESYRYRRDPQEIAGELAEEELNQGNICLQQLASDLKSANEKGKIQTLCASIFQRELLQASQTYSRINASILCSANIEVRKSENNLDLSLLFKITEPDSSTKNEWKSISIGRNAASPQQTATTLASYKLNLGNSNNWKALLKDGACSLNNEALIAIQNDYFNTRHASEKLESCQKKQNSNANIATEIQNKFKSYVPDEWLHDLKISYKNEIFREVSNEKIDSLSTCQKLLNKSTSQIEKLGALSNELSTKYNIPVMKFDNEYRSRKMSSVNLENDQD